SAGGEGALRGQGRKRRDGVRAERGTYQFYQTSRTDSARCDERSAESAGGTLSRSPQIESGLRPKQTGFGRAIATWNPATSRSSTAGCRAMFDPGVADDCAWSET